MGSAGKALHVSAWHFLKEPIEACQLLPPSAVEVSAAMLLQTSSLRHSTPFEREPAGLSGMCT